MSGGEKVLLCELREPVSAKGTRYLSGWLGKARLIGFLDREAEEPVWQVYAQAPEPRPAASDDRQSADRSPFTPARASRPGRGRSPIPAGELNDELSDLATPTADPG